MSQLEDYNTTLLKSLQETESTCLSCGGEASLKYIKLENIEPEIIITVFECENCNIKEVSSFNDKENFGEAMFIECNFDSREDLKRQINLNKNTILTITHEDLEYSFETSESQVYTVEAIILQAIKNLNGQTNGFSTISDVKGLNKSLSQLEALLTNFKFKLCIEDPVGKSRVGHVGEDIYKVQDKPVTYFNDEKVVHSSLYKRNEEI